MYCKAGQNFICRFALEDDEAKERGFSSSAQRDGRVGGVLRRDVGERGEFADEDGGDEAKGYETPPGDGGS